MTRRKHRTGRAGKPRANRTKPLPIVGDLGTGTVAATTGTVVDLLPDPNPNRVSQRRRRDALDRLIERGLLSMRQQQAALAVRDAYLRVQTLSSGGPTQERVQSSPKPDATVAVQIAAMSRLVQVMAALTPSQRSVVEHVCWHGRPLRTMQAFPRAAARFYLALSRVADHLNY